ncbi:GGDEF domain-containing protein [Neobacillus citreus]|uniref:GGDEF domain-containing protein n=1 Tax=Neobacillus citreus TaxID=2833578 RepID=A0A942T0S8_9BACI|nr:GGDEF domain-containing protein [Neobacillus citreus]MCH6269286.1 GGDEF domain-containing protein [Neobacillus citreus]
MVAYIGDIAEQVPCISQNVINKAVDHMFKENTRIQGIVVVNKEIPVSLITRTHFYQTIGTLYGYNVFMERSVNLIINKEPLTVDYFQSITEVSKLAMERKDEERYDYVIVTKDHKYHGIVSIESLLLKLVQVQVEFASYLNPLTSLPGNHIIEEKIKEIIQQESYSILYFDLDQFKAYNDTYGFKKGDNLLQATAELLKNIFVQEGYFLGHIGGDDFIAILSHYDYISICHKIMGEFDELVKQFYSPNHLLQRYVISENRQGTIEKIELVSLSIAIVTNQNRSFETVEELGEYAAIVKKRCKKVVGSCYLINLEQGDGSCASLTPR